MAGQHETVFAATDDIRMFPTFVWKAELEAEVRRRINKGLITRLERIRRCGPEPAPGRGWQSARDLHQWDEFRELASCVNHSVRRVLDFLKIGAADFEITGCWANMNPPDAAHDRHGHPNNFLSGVYYVRTSEGADTINFHDPRSQTEIIKPAGNGVDRREHGSGRGHGEQRHHADFPRLVGALGGRQQKRRDKNKHQFQRHVFRLRGNGEQTALVVGGRDIASVLVVKAYSYVRWHSRLSVPSYRSLSGHMSKPSLPFEMENDLAWSRRPPMFEQEDALVSAQQQRAVANWNGKMGLRERAFDMGRHVVRAFGGMTVKGGVFRRLRGEVVLQITQHIPIFVFLK